MRDDGGRHGILVEYDATTKIFTEPADKRTEDYVTGRFGCPMARVEYQQSLQALEASLQEQGAVALRSVRATVNALESQDVELCDEVVAYDDEIDERYHRIERSIEQLLAQQAPVATDLRLVLAVLHSSIHLERIGDQECHGRKADKALRSPRAAIRSRGGPPRDGGRAAEMVRSRPGRASRPVTSTVHGRSSTWTS